jgi:hypothetical protein
MRPMSRMLNHSEASTVKLARSSQALVLQGADWAQRRWPGPSRRLVQAWLGLLDACVEEPAKIAARPYGLVEELVMLHGEFAQRLLELLEAPGRSRADRSVRDSVVVDFAAAQRRHAAGG